MNLSNEELRGALDIAGPPNRKYPASRGTHRLCRYRLQTLDANMAAYEDLTKRFDRQQLELKSAHLRNQTLLQEMASLQTTNYDLSDRLTEKDRTEANLAATLDNTRDLLNQHKANVDRLKGQVADFKSKEQELRTALQDARDREENLNLRITQLIASEQQFDATIQQQVASINKINAKREKYQQLVHRYWTDLASTRWALEAAKTDFRIESYNTLVLGNCKQRASEKLIETHMEDKLRSGKDIRSLFTEIEAIIAHYCRFLPPARGRTPNPGGRVSRGRYSDRTSRSTPQP